MKMNHKCARAVAAILAAHASTAAYVAAAADQSASAEAGSATAGIQEVVVTAQRRTENAQDVPIAIQAFTGDTLQQLNVTSFDDLVRYLPNVSAASAGPGQDQIFMRGLSAGNVATQSGGSINGFPNVAIYLDEQSGQLPGRNLDVYAADLERIEVLEGPQGTLFGAGAQAGVIRYITNKPKLNVTEGNVSGGYGVTAGGDPNSDVTAVLNLPLIPDTLAVRGVVYDDQRGGYINNVPASFTRNAATDLSIHYANYPTGCGPNSSPPGPPCQVPPGSPVINNYAVAEKAINPVTYKGARVSALWNINDEWNALITQTYQDMDAEGVFYQMPTSSDGAPLSPQSVTLFNNSYNKDRFENTALVVNGRIGVLKAVYAGSYLVRNVSTVQDYTNYARGKYGDYYQCHGVDGGLAPTCFSPSTTWNETERNTHQSHEIRLSTPDEWRLRGIAGIFWEDLRIYDQLNWDYKTLPSCTSNGPPGTPGNAGCLTDIGPLPGSSVNNPALLRPYVAFFNDVQRGYKQRAFFTSLDFDIVPKVLTVTAGTRYYHFDNDEKGAVVGTATFNPSIPSCYDAGFAPCTRVATNIDAENLQTTYKGFKSRANLTWHILPDVFAYYTWSQGFRPGAFNRNFNCYIPDANGIPQYCNPLAYESDNLTNNELGWKTEWLNRRLQWNGAVYQEDWKNVQVSFFDPGLLGNVGFNANGPDYRIRGVETSIIAVLTRGLTAQGGASWTSSEQTNSPFLIDNNNGHLIPGVPASPNFGNPILSAPNPYGPPGSPSSFAPPFQFNARLRYQWAMSSYNLFAQAGVTHTAHSFTQSGSNPPLTVGGISTNQLRFENPAYTEYDVSFGVDKGAWRAELYGLNITNVITSAFTSDAQFALQQTITRPRVLGLRIGYKF
jgi:iron complex outermembrane receptor protein